MCLDDAAADGQTDTGAADALLHGSLDSEELVEDLRQGLGRNADAAVFNADLQLLADNSG